MYCENCGKELEEDVRFCTYCGAKIGEKNGEKTLVLDMQSLGDETEILEYQTKRADSDEHELGMPLKAGMVLGDTYEIIGEIGSGGGGIVYQARHLRLQADVVVKKIKDEVCGKLQIRQEADILKGLKHPNLPRVYDFIETENAVYTVMDFIHGENLDEAVKRHGRFSQKQVKKWAEQLGEALKYLHSQKPPIVHSDIKPANIMLTQDGDVCLIDFNISLAMGGTMESAVGISAGFSPPEQYRDPVLYRRLTQNYTRKLSESADDATGVLRDSRGDETEVLMNDLNGAAEILSTDLSGVTERLSTVLGDVTERLPGNPGDATEILSADFDGTTEILPENLNNATEVLAGNKNNTTEVLAGNKSDVTEVLTENLFGDRTEVESQSLSGEELPSYQGGDRTGAAVGSASKYTQYIGKGIDTRSDIYSLGITLYFLLTGIEPSVDFEKRIPIDRINIAISEGFALIINKMTELDPKDRYQNGGQFLHALQHIYELDSEYRAYQRRRRILKLISAVFLIVGAFVWGSGFGIRQKERNTNYNRNMVQAKEYIEAGNFGEASLILTDAMEDMPERIEAYSSEVLRLYGMGDFEECISYAVDVLENPDYKVESEEDQYGLGDIYYILGNCYIEKEDYSDAELYLEKAIEKYDKNSLYYRDYAIALAKQGEIAKAEQALDHAITLYLGEDSIYMVQGEILFAKGENEAAKEHLLKAIAFTEDDSLRKRAVLLCDKVYCQLGTDYIDQEIELLEQEENRAGGAASAMNISERLADVYVRKAEADEGRRGEYYEKAVSKFEFLYENGYSTRQMMENIGILYEQTGDFNKAEEILTEMVEKYPDNYIGYKRLAYLEADKQQNKENEERDYQQMKEYYDMAKELYGGNADDQEMQMLDNLMQDLKNENWL